MTNGLLLIPAADLAHIISFVEVLIFLPLFCSTGQEQTHSWQHSWRGKTALEHRGPVYHIHLRWFDPNVVNQDRFCMSHFTVIHSAHACIQSKICVTACKYQEYWIYSVNPRHVAGRLAPQAQSFVRYVYWLLKDLSLTHTLSNPERIWRGMRNSSECKQWGKEIPKEQDKNIEEEKCATGKNHSA